MCALSLSSVEVIPETMYHTGNCTIIERLFKREKKHSKWMESVTSNKFTQSY